jgi:hypothetical protein
LIVLLSGLVLAAAAASPQPSAGVGWSLAQPADWSPEERATLDQLAASLPDGLRDVGRPVSILRGSSGPATPGEPVRIRYRPGAAEIEIAEGKAVGPALVHGLAHVADRGHGWSREPAWRSLSQWRQRLGFWLSPERDPLAFALPRGMQNPAEDLATLAEVGFAGPLTNPDRHPACRMPSKWRFLTDRVGAPAQTPQCVDLQTAGLDPAQVEHIEVVYVAATGAAAASVSGHVLIALRFHPDDQGIVRQDSFGMVADTTGVAEGSLAYAWRGITGGFRARVVREPFTTTTLRYSQFEDRSLHRFRLRLTEAEKVQVLQRLDEILQAWDRPYLFVSRNCTELVVELVNSFSSLRAPAPLSPDVLMALLDREGLLEPIAA